MRAHQVLFSSSRIPRFSRFLKASILWVLILSTVFFQTSTVLYAAPSSGDRSDSVKDEALEKQVKQARKLLREGNVQGAEDAYRQILSGNPQAYPARIGLAWLMMKERRLKDAFEEATRLTVEAPFLPQGYSIRALALVRSGYFSQAYEDLKTALKINNHDEIAMATIAEMAYYENRLGEAERLVYEALAINHDEPDYHLLRARIASRLEHFRVAATALQDFLRLTPKSDVDRRARIEGVIRFYSYLGDSHTNVLQTARSSSVPLSIRARRPHVQIKVNGKGPLNFVVDTGAGISVISLKAAERLGLKPIAQGGFARAVGGSGTFPIVYGLLNSLELGDARLTQVPVYIREIQGPSGSANEGTDGFLGLSVLTEFLVTLDYQKKEMRLDPNKNVAPDPTETTEGVAPSVIPFRLTESGLISVETQLDDGGKMNFIFDSGASTSVISDATVARLQWQHKILPDEKVRIVGAAGITQNVDLLLIKSVQISDLLKQDVRLPILDLVRLNESSGFEQHGILGGDFLYHCRVQIDFHNQNLLITPMNSTVRRVDQQIGKGISVP